MTTLAPRPHKPAAPSLALDQLPLRPRWTMGRAMLAFVAAAAVVLSLWGVRRVDLSLFALIDGWPETRNLLERMLPPRLAAEDRATITRAVFDTFFMAFAGTSIAMILAVPLAFAAANNVMPLAPVRLVARGVIVFTRAVPTIVFALVFVRVFGIGVIPGILAIGIHSIGMLGKLLADAIENIDPGPREGVIATGAGSTQELLTGVWSQITPSAISLALYRLEIDFRSAPILGFVGAGGIGVIMRGYQGNLRYPELLGVTLLIVVLVIGMEMVSTMARRAILGSEVKQDESSDGSTAPVRRTGVVAAADVPLEAPWTRDRIKLHVAGWVTIALFVASFVVPGVSLREFFGSLGELPGVFWRMVPKDMTWLTDNVVSDLVETVAIGFASTFMALLVALPLSFLAASNTAPGRLVYRSTRLLALLLRAAPDLVIAVILVAAIGLGPAAGSIALAIGMIGFSIKLFADNIEEVRPGPRDGVFATGSTRLQEAAVGVTPQVLPSMVGNMLYLLDISLRSSTVLGIVGAGGIGFLLNNAAKTLKFEVMGGIVLCIFGIVYAIELLANWIRKQII
jgi:phosphonate transport system permease protein